MRRSRADLGALSQKTAIEIGARGIFRWERAPGRCRVSCGRFGLRMSGVLVSSAGVEIPAKFNVLGVGVHALRFAQARELALARARERHGGYVCFCDVNSVSCARRDAAHRARLAGAFLVAPDGMPLVWMGRRQMGRGAVERVYGPDLMLALCAENGVSHFFYGGGAGVAELLAEKLGARFPGLRVAGAMTPPFHELDEAELAVLAARVAMLRPDFFWVGLGAPKQEKFMARFAPRVSGAGTVLLGVGAAFDFLSGRVRQAPRWLRQGGLEWVYRLCAEPRRLAPRYFKNNPLFAARALAQACGARKYPLGE